MATTATDIISNLIRNKLYEVHTTMPAVVTKVSYDEGLVSVRPLVSDKRSSFKNITYEEIHDIPLFTYSAAGNTAQVCVPVKTGDTVAIHFSQREASGFILGNGKETTEPDQLAPLGLYPLYAVPCVHPIAIASRNPIDPNNIVVKNGSTEIIVEPSGNVIINCVDFEVNSSGNTEINTTNFNVNSSTFTHNDTNVGDDHTHGGVTPGGSSTSVPD